MSTSGKLIASFAHLDEVNAAVFSPDGARILTASADKTAKLWDAASGKLIASFGHKDGVEVAAFSSRWCSDPDGKRRQHRQALGCGLREARRFFYP